MESLGEAASTHNPFLSPEQIDQFHRDGFLVLPGYFSAETVSKLRSEIASVITTMDPQDYPIFTTNEQDRQVSADYFLTSGDKIVPFLEEKAAKLPDGAAVPFHLRINKIGHALHDLNPVFHEVSYDPKVGRICRDLGSVKPMAVQSMYIFKQPNIGGEVGMHQDGSFLYTVPQTCVGFWWALDDCTTTNGCLYALPGSHKEGVRRQFRRRADVEAGTEFVPAEADSWDRTGEVSLECPAGTLVLIHHSVVHYSAANTSPHPRHAYSIHTVDSREGVVYPPENWLQRCDGSPFNCVPYQ